MVTPMEVSDGQSQVPPLNQRNISGLATLNLPVVVENKVLIPPTRTCTQPRNPITPGNAQSYIRTQYLYFQLCQIDLSKPLRLLAPSLR